MNNDKVDTLSLIQKQTITSFDSEQLSDVIKGADFELYQIEKGSFRADLFQATLGSGTLNRGKYSLGVLTKGSLSKDYMTCGFVHDIKSEGCLNGTKMQKHDILIGDEGGPLDCNFGANTLWSSFQFKREDLLKTGIKLTQDNSKLYRLDTNTRNAFSLKLGEIFNYLEEFENPLTPSINADMLYNHLLSMYAQIFNHSTSHIHLKKSEAGILAKKIYHYLNDHATKPIQMIDLTTLTGKSERTVERIFKKYFGVPPYAYLKLHRLHLIRHQLIQAESSCIGDIALKHGFLQMGYFGNEYKKLFNETPSQTLRKQ